jgi:hypothetical protein
MPDEKSHVSREQDSVRIARRESFVGFQKSDLDQPRLAIAKSQAYSAYISKDSPKMTYLEPVPALNQRKLPQSASTDDGTLTDSPTALSDDLFALSGGATGDNVAAFLNIKPETPFISKHEPIPVFAS